MDNHLTQWLADMKAVCKGEPVLGKHYVLNDNLYIWQRITVIKDGNKTVQYKRWHRLTALEVLEKYHKDSKWSVHLNVKTWLESFTHKEDIGSTRRTRFNPHVDE